jgi:hypothetical protein
MRVLVHRLTKYELTKGEVVMILNLGLGMEDWEGRMPPRLRGGRDGVRSAEEQRTSDEWVLGAVCEELEQRFGPESIAEILGTVGEVLSERIQADKNGSSAWKGRGPIADKMHGMVSESTAKNGMGGTDGVHETEDVEMEDEEQQERK